MSAPAPAVEPFARIMGMFSGPKAPAEEAPAASPEATHSLTASGEASVAAAPTPAAPIGTGPRTKLAPKHAAAKGDAPPKGDVWAPVPRTSLEFQADMEHLERPRGSLTHTRPDALEAMFRGGGSGLPDTVDNLGSDQKMEVQYMPNRARRRSSVSTLIKRVDAEETNDASQDQLNLRLLQFNTPKTEAEVADDAAERRYVIDPEARWYLTWIAFLSICATYSSSIVGYQLAFIDTVRGVDPFLVIEWVIDALFLVDMISNFFVGYYEEDVKVMIRSKCRHNYLHTVRFALDFIACMPIDLVQIATGWSPLTRANKLVRLYSLAHHMKILQGSSHKPQVINTIKIIKLVMIWLLLPHLFACLRVLLLNYQRYDDEVGTWKEIKMEGGDTINPIVASSNWVRYLQSLNWCMGLMTGFGDGNIPENSLQFFYTLALINLGLFTFAYTVGVLGAMGAAGSQRANDFQVLVHAISRFTERYGIQDALLERITTYLRHRWEAVVGGERELVDAKELLEQLPRTMRYEAVETMTKDTLSKVPLFARVEEGFIHALTQKMQAVNCSIGEVLVRQGEMNETFYIVLNGSLSVMQDGRFITTLNPGNFFGERTLLSKTAAKATVTSTSFCELYKLQKWDLQMLRINFPETFVGFEQAAKLEAKNADKMNRAKKQAVAAGIEEPKMKWWIILPNSRTRAVWAFFLYTALAYDVYALPFKFVFIGDTIDPVLVALDVVCDLTILVDVFLRFCLAFYIDGRLISEPKLIRQRYLQGTSEARFVRMGGTIVQGGRLPFWRGLLNGTFLPILLSSLPWVLLTPFWPLADARWLQAVRLARLVRFLPMLRLDRVTKQQPTGLDELLRLTRKSAFDLQYTAKRLLPLIAAYTVLAHYVACGYFAVVLSVIPPHELDYGVLFLPVDEVGDRSVTYGTSPLGENITSGLAHPWRNSSRIDHIIGDSEWLPSRAYLQYGNTMLWYFRSLYYSVCNLTGLGKSPSPLYPASVAYTIFTFVVGVLVFAYITSSIVTLVMNANAPLVMYRAKKNALLGYMSDAHVDPNVLTRANKWLEHWWYAHGGTPAGFVIDQLPPSLKEEVRYRVFQKTTSQCRVFLPLWDHVKKKPRGSIVGEDATKSDMRREQMVREIITMMNFEVYNPGEWVLHKGMLNDWLYVVAVGTADVLLAEPDHGGADHATRGPTTAKQFQHIKGKVVQELCTGDVFGEISTMYRNKCEASVRAQTPLEVIAIPRVTMMKVLHLSPALMERLLALIRKRRRENELLRAQGDPESKDIVHSTIIAKMAARRLARFARNQLKRRKSIEAEARLAANMGAAAGAAAADSKKPDLSC